MTTETDPVRILKSSSCTSLSGKSTLTYNIGSDSNSEVQFQVTSNDGGGYFNADWVSQQSIQAVLSKLPKGFGITSGTFRAVYPSKSTNSPGFLLAVLKDVGLIGTMESNRRCYEQLDPSAFIAAVNELLEADLDTAPEAIKKSAGKGKASKGKD